MKNLTSLFVLLLCVCLIAVGQRRSCVTMEHLEMLQDHDPSTLYRLQRIEDFTEFRSKSNLRMGRSIITIPVVIHVVYNSEAQNISDDQIRSQIEVLNEDFGRNNADASETPSMFYKVAADTRIRFELATTDPSGQPTYGITRTYTDAPDFSAFENEMKFSVQGGVDAWPTSDYLNIWVCALSMGVLGYSQFPGGPSGTDGVVIDYKFFGRGGKLKPPFNLGRTATHEVGHWLNLRHIWGDGPCGTDDFVADTPESEGPTHGCLRERITCGSQDMVSNFMDYTDDACMNLFTQGQAHRMRSLFEVGGAREQLLYSHGLELEPMPIVYTEIEAPILLNTAKITNETASLEWEPVSQAESYRLRLKTVDSDEWSERDFRRNSVRVSQLRSCTNYEFQVASVTSEGKTSEFSLPAVFKTLGCVAEAPTELIAASVYTTEAVLEWNPLEGVEGYKVQYRKAGTRDIISIETFENRITLSDLDPGNWYQYRVKAISSGNFTPYSKVETFFTNMPNARMARVSQYEYLRAYPSHNGDYLEVEFDDIPRSYVNISLKNRYGDAIFQKRDIRMERGMPYNLDTRKVRSGYYILQVEDDQGFVHEKEVRVGYR